MTLPGQTAKPKGADTWGVRGRPYRAGIPCHPDAGKNRTKELFGGKGPAIKTAVDVPEGMAGQNGGRLREGSKGKGDERRAAV